VSWQVRGGAVLLQDSRACDRPLSRRRLSKFQPRRQIGLLPRLWLPASYFWSGRVEALAPVYDVTPTGRGRATVTPARGRK
jgi:hypothetical protein